MARTLLRRADVISLDHEGHVWRGVDVAIAGDKIEAVDSVPADFAPDEIIDAQDHILLPAFFNAHTHTPLTLLRGAAEDLPLDRWYNERVWALESGLTGEDVYWGAALAAAEMIRGGTAGFADQYFYMDRVAQVVEASGLRASLGWCQFGLEGGEIGTDLPGIARFVEEWQGAAGGRITTALAPHSAHMCSPQFLARTAAVANRLGATIHIQVALTQEQVAQSLADYDLTPVEVLDRNGILDSPAVLAHGIYLQREDYAILAARNATVVQCPTQQMKLALGVTPVPALRALGVNVAVGSGAPAANNTLSMLQEARQAALVQKLVAQDAGAIGGQLALRMITQNGATALGFPLSGEISPGHNADLILIDCARPALRPRHDLAANVIYAAEDAAVSDVMVAGRWLMRERTLLTLDEERILWEAEARAERLLRGDRRPRRKYLA